MNSIYILYSCELGSHPRPISYFSNYPAAKTSLENYMEMEKDILIEWGKRGWDINEVVNPSGNVHLSGALCCYSIGHNELSKTYYFIRVKTIHNEPTGF